MPSVRQRVYDFSAPRGKSASPRSIVGLRPRGGIRPLRHKRVTQSPLRRWLPPGDIDGAIALNLKLYPLFRGVAPESSPIPVKYMLKRLGVLKGNEHRSPLVPASPDAEKQLGKISVEIGLV